jgi:uncharacterized phage protein (TIGR01671 family)
MTREIKFRAWDKGHRKMSYKVNLYSLNISGKIDRVQIDAKQIMNIPGHNCEIMQFTGLHDKNGKEIYEGDIVKTPASKSVVEFDKGLFGLNHDYGTDNKTMLGSWGSECNLRCLYDGYHRKIEVIGNIHENSNLL